jgi:LysR family transcriptional regulator (chromosome initiation inhibitor)
MNPAVLARPLIAEGKLVELTPGAWIAVKLYWKVTRLHASALTALTDAVCRAARSKLLQSE